MHMYDAREIVEDIFFVKLARNADFSAVRPAVTTPSYCANTNKFSKFSSCG
jgi:hypothetical protein